MDLVTWTVFLNPIRNRERPLHRRRATSVGHDSRPARSPRPGSTGHGGSGRAAAPAWLHGARRHPCWQELIPEAPGIQPPTGRKWVDLAESGVNPLSRRSDDGRLVPQCRGRHRLPIADPAACSAHVAIGSAEVREPAAHPRTDRGVVCSPPAHYDSSSSAHPAPPAGVRRGGGVCPLGGRAPPPALHARALGRNPRVESTTGAAAVTDSRPSPRQDASQWPVLFGSSSLP